MRIAVGVDASSSFIGLGRIEPDAAYRCGRLTVSVVRPVESTSRTMARLLEAMGPMMAGVELALVEQPPPTTRSTHRRGSQAVVGFGIGRAVGWVEGAAASLACPRIELIDVLAWRRTRNRLGRELGVRLPVGVGQGLPNADATDVESDRQKAYSVAVAMAAWPAAIRALVDDATGRARTDKPIWRLAGVSDGCEGALIAFHGAVL